MKKIILPHDHGNNEKDKHMVEMLQRKEDFATVAEVFKQLDDSTRLRIFWILCHCEECVINISAMMEMSSPAVSHHLRQLKNGGLIKNRREGKEVYYTASTSEKARLLHVAIEKMMEISCP